MKCDERRPFCRKCTAFGRRCGGYEVQTDSPQSSTSTGNELVTVKSPPTFPFLTSAQESHALDFYLNRTISQVSRLSRGEFWHRLIPQALYTDPGIRHAAFALAAMHQTFEQTGDVAQTSSFNEFAFREYDLAIREHLAYLSDGKDEAYSVGAYLVSCVLFVCLEMVQRHYKSAVSLILQAVDLFHRLCALKNASSIWPLEVLETLLCRLQIQAMDFAGPHALERPLLPKIKANAMPDIPSEFKSIAEAEEHYEFYRTWFELNALTSEADDRSPLKYSSMVSKWVKAMKGLEGRLQDEDKPGDRQTIAILKIQQLFYTTSLQVAQNHTTDDEREDAWDFCTSIFQQILDCCEVVVAAEERQHNHVFTLESGVVAPLYDVARACRDPKLRRRAVNMLRRYSCREGLLDASLAAHAASRVVELEEAAAEGEVECPADVPKWARIRWVLPKFKYAEGRVVIWYGRRTPDNNMENAESFEETISWNEPDRRSIDEIIAAKSTMHAHSQNGRSFL